MTIANCKSEAVGLTLSLSLQEGKSEQSVASVRMWFEWKNDARWCFRSLTQTAEWPSFIHASPGIQWRGYNFKAPPYFFPVLNVDLGRKEHLVIVLRYNLFCVLARSEVVPLASASHKRGLWTYAARNWKREEYERMGWGAHWICQKESPHWMVACCWGGFCKWGQGYATQVMKDASEILLYWFPPLGLEFPITWFCFWSRTEISSSILLFFFHMFQEKLESANSFCFVSVNNRMLGDTVGREALEWSGVSWC